MKYNSASPTSHHSILDLESHSRPMSDRSVPTPSSRKSSSTVSNGGSDKSGSNASSKEGVSKNRARIACDACRKRRTKCSGLPGPCVLCRQHDTFCHFHPQLDARRKDSLKTGDSNRRRESILCGLLLALRLNSEAELQPLLDVLRSPTSSVQDMAKSLCQQLRLVHDQDGTSESSLTEDDIISLALSNVVNHRLLFPNRSNDDDLLNQSLQLLTANDRGSAILSNNSNASSPSFSDGSNLNTRDVWQYGSNFHSMPRTMYSNGSTLHTDAAPKTLNQTTTQRTDLDGYRFPIFDEQGQLNHTSLPTTHGMSSLDMNNTVDYGMHDYITFDSPTDVDQYLWSQFDLPLSPPLTDLGKLCMDFRDSGRQMLAHGISLQDLGSYGRMDCELLFRDRTSHDAMNIPNWACEIARRLPPLCPGTRIALALCIFRMMPYLLAPSQSTWDLLPLALRPTESQFQRPHGITISFLPIPILRSLLVQKPVDWLKHASQHDLRLEWPGSWGDVGGAPITEVGNWRETYRSTNKRKPTSLTPLPTSDDLFEDLASKLEAVTIDATSGRRCVTNDFEQHCWAMRNWHIGKGILNIWPELEGQFQVT